MPSPESPANRIVTRSSSWTSVCRSGAVSMATVSVQLLDVPRGTVASWWRLTRGEAILARLLEGSRAASRRAAGTSAAGRRDGHGHVAGRTVRHQLERPGRLWIRVGRWQLGRLVCDDNQHEAGKPKLIGDAVGVTIDLQADVTLVVGQVRHQFGVRGLVP